MFSEYSSDNLNDSTRLNDSRLNESLNSSKLKKKRAIEDYDFIVNENSKLKTSDLGKGSYGTVKKVKDRLNGKTYAMKIMNKKAIFEYSSKENLKREITIQRDIIHPNIVRLYTYFEDSENVYLVLEYAENGSLFQYLRRKRKFIENEAFVYFFQTCLGIDYLHKRNVIHRDLKPENLLLDIDGNIKLCDFGWSADTSSKRQTFCGTVDYMAPEMVKNQSHDHRLDIWCLGVLLYEMLHGYAPFKGRNDQEKCRNISMNMPLDFDPSLSLEVVDLIRKILQPAPVNRISMNELFNHSWMKKAGKAYNIDVMSYVKQQDEQIKELQKNGSLSFDKNEKAGSESLVTKELSRPAKIITVIDDTAPIKLSQSSAGHSKKMSYGGSTQGSETSSIGSEYGTNSAQLNYIGKDKQLGSAKQILSAKLESSSNKKSLYESEQSPMFKAGYASVSDAKYNNNSYEVQNKLYIHNEAFRQNDIDKYLSKSNLHRQKTTQLEKAFNNEYTSQDKVEFPHSGKDNYLKSSSLYDNGKDFSASGNKAHGDRVGKLNSFYNDDDEFTNGPRASRISKRNVAIEKTHPKDGKEKQEAGFFDGLLNGFTCLLRDNAKK